MTLKTSLLPHQQAAVDKLRRLKVGALYMEMGTGKTRTALELIKLRLDAGRIDAVLWLCPCSVKQNLATDIRRHADVLPGEIAICGIESISGSQRIAGELLNLVMCRETMLVVDESNLVKNPRALRSRRIERLADACRYKIILNGTPVSRTEADLYQQWRILDWRILGYASYYTFAANHIEYDEKFRGKIRRVLNVDYLTDKIAPYTFQIKKADCLSLPEKEEVTVSFDMTWEQREHYNEVLDSFLSLELLAEEEGSSVLIYKTLTALQLVASGRRITSAPLDPILHEPLFRTPEDNPRIRELLDVVNRWIGAEKAVVWCRYRDEIDSVIAALTSAGYRCARFDGTLTMTRRMESLDDFRGGAQFLVANKTCAGYGLNLQFCRNAIYYSNDWDWATRSQSEDRLHRIGQTRTVCLYNLCARCGIDERILSCLSRKGNMVDDFRRELKARNLSEWLRAKAESDLIDAGGNHDTDRTEREAEAAGDPGVRPGA